MTVASNTFCRRLAESSMPPGVSVCTVVSVRRLQKSGIRRLSDRRICISLRTQHPWMNAYSVTYFRAMWLFSAPVTRSRKKPTLRSALYDYCFGCPKALNPPAVRFAVFMHVRKATISLDFPAEIGAGHNLADSLRCSQIPLHHSPAFGCLQCSLGHLKCGHLAM